MRKLRRFALKHRPLLFFVFMVSATFLSMTMLAGCQGTFLSEAPSILQAVLASLTSLSGILTLFGVPVSGAAFVALNIANQEITEINKLIAAYKTTPDETTLQKIEQGIQAVLNDLGPLLAPVGLPATASQKIAAIGAIILSQLEAWLALFPKSQASTAAVEKAHLVLAASSWSAANHGVPMVPKILSAKDFANRVNAVLEASTGDKNLDAKFAKIPRVQIQSAA